MASVDLVFAAAPLTRGDLVFGDDGTATSSDAHVSGAVTLAKPVLSGGVALGVTATAPAGITLVKPTLSGTVRYFTDTQRPLVAQVAVRFQQADDLEAGASIRQQQALPVSVATAVRFQDAAPLQRGTAVRAQDAARVRVVAVLRFQDGKQAFTGTAVAYQDATPARLGKKVRFQDAIGTSRMAGIRFQDATKVRNRAAVRFQDGTPLFASVTEREGYGLPVEVGFGSRFQDAIRPPPGVSKGTEPPAAEPCYVPDTNLVFSEAWSTDTNLVFICERHVPPPEPGATVVVPIRKVYAVENHIALQRVDNGAVIEADAFAMSLDFQSWTWQWSASLPASALSLIAPGVDGDPVQLLATVNGVAYRLTAEGYSRERSFAQARVRVQGRGRAAELDAPYAPVLNHASAGDLTAQQLMARALTINGVGIGWDVDFGLDDWTVPGGTWSFQGNYIGAVLDIAQAAGGYVQPHRTDATLRILPRYPLMPHQWGDLTPDFDLPEDVAAVEGIEWRTLPDYNRIFVSGTTSSGVLGQVTRAGTAGDSIAPMVTHSLIAHPTAARQRGLAELSNTGRQALVSLRMPVLEETGIIHPGSVLRYAGGSRLGIVRSTALSWARPVLRQTIAIETHPA